MRITKQKTTTTKKIILFLLLACLITLGALAYFQLQNKQPSENNKDSTITNDSSKVGDHPPKNPTDKETAPNTDHPTPISVDDSGKKMVQIVASTDSTEDAIYIRGGINNASVHEGDCFAQLTGPQGESIRKNTSLLQNATTTDCKTIVINKTELSQGEWRATLNYLSSDTKGVSNEVSFTVQ